MEENCSPGCSANSLIQPSPTCLPQAACPGMALPSMPRMVPPTMPRDDTAHSAQGWHHPQRLGMVPPTMG